MTTTPTRPARDDEPGADTHSTSRRHDGVRDGVWYCTKVFLAVRIGLTLLVLVSSAVLPRFAALPKGAFAGGPPIPGPVDVSGWPARPVQPGWGHALASWERFDALWYLRIADAGYRQGDGSAAFFPLYPLVTRALSFAFGGHPLAAGLLVSNAAFAGALIVLYLLARAEIGEDAARRAVVYAAVFPAALFFFAPYSESLFLFLAVLAFWAARRAMWELAGAAGALAALTRNVGVLLLLPLGIEAVHQALEQRSWRWPVRGLVWSLAPAAGTVIYLAYWKTIGDDWLAPLHDQQNWQRDGASPFGTLAGATRAAFEYIGAYPGGYHLLDWLVAVPVLAAAVYAVARLRPAYSAYLLASILVPLALPFAGRPLMSFFRFAATMFPVYLAAAAWTRRHPGAHDVVVGSSAALLGVMTLLFVNWFYIF